ncbi:MAG: DUF1801 domain-containing protein [Pseudomonadales bacterium]
MNNSVQAKFDAYPDVVRPRMLELREHILVTANEYTLGEVEETLKWGELSYLVKGGSAVRIDWKQKHADSCFVFFNCKTTLIETFKEVYGPLLNFEGKRAIKLPISEQLPSKELKHCISLALRYHALKDQTLLGC